MGWIKNERQGRKRGIKDVKCRIRGGEAKGKSRSRPEVKINNHDDAERGGGQDREF